MIQKCFTEKHYNEKQLFNITLLKILKFHLLFIYTVRKTNTLPKMVALFVLTLFMHLILCFQHIHCCQAQFRIYTSPWYIPDSKDMWCLSVLITAHLDYYCSWMSCFPSLCILIILESISLSAKKKSPASPKITSF